MVDNVDVERTAPPSPHPPIDPSVTIPDRVKAAAALAESFYKPAEPQAEPPAEPVVTPPEPPAEPVVTPPEPPVEPPAQPEQKKRRQRAPAPGPDDENDETWRQRFLSMQGRYEQSQRTIGSLQDQMTQMGDELMRVQALLAQAPPRQQSPAPATPRITPDDEQAYGPELIDLARRAAVDALSPEIDQLRQQNQRLQRRVAQEAQMGVAQLLDRDIPNWREINRDPKFISWLRLRDVYSGGVRKQLLNAAFQAADAPRVKAFFEGFIADEAVAGNEDHQAPQEPAPATPPVPREPAVRIETITAPGKARPASGNPPSPADKPIFTRAQIATFYSNVRAGYFAGRDNEKNALEQQIFAAQKEGRIR